MLSRSELIELTKSVAYRLLQNLIFVILVYCIWYPIFNFPSALSWHVILCTLGVLPFFTEGLLLFGYDLYYALEFDKETKVWIHVITSSIGTVLITCGTVLAIGHSEGENFSSAHGVLGLVFLISIFIVLVLGFLAKFAESLRGYAKPILFVFLHNFAGIVCFILSIACLCTGFNGELFASPEESKIAATIVTSLLCVWCLTHSLYKLYREIATLTGH